MILVLNCGSQSIKYKLFEDDLRQIKEKRVDVKAQKDYQRIMMRELRGLEKYRNSIGRVCHRIVHGGERFRAPILITKKNLREIEKYNKLAPLHNPFNILGIKSAERVFSRAKQIAVFDTAFYRNLAVKAFIYPLPVSLRNKYGFRRFGFHGISHEYAAREAAKKAGKPFGKLKIISCHLGGGASICAIDRGKVIDTSMGFTPAEGLMMMTRTGDIDPGILLQLCQDFGPRKTNDIINHLSGVKGICGFSDMRDVLKALKRGNKPAMLALDIFAYRIQKYIGAYFAVLRGCDVLVLTGAIGSGSSKIRNMILKGLHILNKTKVCSIKTDEELMIAQKSKHV